MNQETGLRETRYLFNSILFAEGFSINISFCYITWVCLSTTNNELQRLPGGYPLTVEIFVQFMHALLEYSVYKLAALPCLFCIPWQLILTFCFSLSHQQSDMRASFMLEKSDSELGINKHAPLHM